MLEAVGEVFPEAKYQRYVVHFYRNVFSTVPRSKGKIVAKMLKAIHAQESKAAAKEKAKAVIAALRDMKLREAAAKIENSIEETLTCMDFPYEFLTRLKPSVIAMKYAIANGCIAFRTRKRRSVTLNTI